MVFNPPEIKKNHRNMHFIELKYLVCRNLPVICLMGLCSGKCTKFVHVKFATYFENHTG